MEILLVLVGVIGLTLGILCYNAFVWGFVAHTLYGWFILSAFADAPHFSILQVVGFALFLGALKPSLGVSIKSEYEDNSKMWGKLLITPWLVLLFAWFIHLFY
jgi:hypothetical protein